MSLTNTFSLKADKTSSRKKNTLTRNWDWHPLSCSYQSKVTLKTCASLGSYLKKCLILTQKNLFYFNTEKSTLGYCLFLLQDWKPKATPRYITFYIKVVQPKFNNWTIAPRQLKGQLLSRSRRWGPWFEIPCRNMFVI